MGTIQRGICAFLAVLLLFTQVLFAHTPEISFWDARRAVSREKLASVSCAPAVRPVNPFDFSRAIIARHLTTAVPAGILKSMSDAVAAAGNAMTLQSIRLPSGALSPESPVVVMIEDVHGHREAQKNIATALERLSDRFPDAVLGIEGAEGDIDAARFRGPTEKGNRLAAGYLLAEQIIAGPEYAALAHGRPISLFGVEEKDLYLRNVAAVRAALPLRRKAARAEAGARAQRAGRAARIFSSDLQAFAADVDAYEDESLGLPDFLERLARRRGFHGDRYPALAEFLATLSLEKSLDTAKIERERTRLISRLSKTLPQADLESFLQAGVAFQAGRLSLSDLNSLLSQLTTRAGISLSLYPDLSAYLAYVARADRLSAEKIISESNAAQEAVWSALCSKADQRALVGERRQGHLRSKLAALTLTPDEFRGLENPTDATLKPFVDFYAAAEARNDAIARSLSRRIRKSGVRTGVLVAGGFHTEGVSERLAAQGTTVLVFSPRLKDLKDPGAADYLSIFTRERTPLEQLFATPRLSLARTPAIAPLYGIDKVDVARIAAEIRAMGVVFTLAQEKGGIPDQRRVNELLANDPVALLASEGLAVHQMGISVVGYFSHPHPHDITVMPAENALTARVTIRPAGWPEDPALEYLIPLLNPEDRVRLAAEIRAVGALLGEMASADGAAPAWIRVAEVLANDPKARRVAEGLVVRMEGVAILCSFAIPWVHQLTVMPGRGALTRVARPPKPKPEKELVWPTPLNGVRIDPAMVPRDGDSLRDVVAFLRERIADGTHRWRSFAIFVTKELDEFPPEAVKDGTVHYRVREHMKTYSIQHSLFLPPGFEATASALLSTFLLYMRPILDPITLRLVEDKLAEARAEDQRWHATALSLGLSETEVTILNKYTDDFLYRNRHSVRMDRDALLKDLVNPDIFAVRLAPIPREVDWRKWWVWEFEAWREKFLRKFSEYHRDYLNNLPLEIRLKLFRPKVFSDARDAALRDYFGGPRSAPGAFTLETGAPLSAQGVTLVDIVDASSGRGHPNKGPVYRLTFEKDGRRFTTFMKTYLKDGTDREAIALRSRFEPFFFGAAAAVGLPSTFVRYYPEQADPHLGGYILMDAIPGAASNTLVEGTGADKRLRADLAPHAGALITGMARWAALSDAIVAADRPAVPFAFDFNPNNFLIREDALKHDDPNAVVSIDHEYLFNPTDTFFLDYIARYGAGEIGVLLTMQGSDSPEGLSRLYERYAAAYREQWRIVRENRASLEALINTTFGPDSVQLSRFRASIEVDPSVRLERQRAALLLFASTHPRLKPMATAMVHDSLPALRANIGTEDVWFNSHATITSIGGSWLPNRTYARRLAWIVELAVAVFAACILPEGTSPLMRAAVAASVVYLPHLLIRWAIYREVGVWRDPKILAVTVLTFAAALIAFMAGLGNPVGIAALSVTAFTHLAINLHDPAPVNNRLVRDGFDVAAARRRAERDEARSAVLERPGDHTISLEGPTLDAARNMDPTTVVAFDVGPFLDGANADVAAEHILHRVRGFRERGSGDALIFLAPDDGAARERAEAAITAALLALAHRAGLEPQMTAYLAASPFVPFDGNAFDPDAVFAGSVSALLRTREPAVIQSAMKSRRLSLLTGSASRVLNGDFSRDIEIYLLDAGLRAIPMLRAIETELRAARIAAKNA